jgi:hypothetical protein
MFSSNMGFRWSLYTDCGSHYFHTPKAGEKVDPRALTQVGRALAQLGIEHIAAYSPQARGRCERIFRTLQDEILLFCEPIVGVMRLKARAGKTAISARSRGDPCRIRLVL